ncbi:hypothetical protein ACO0LD_16155 [Undibacterium sp. Ji83W]|uniref:hypothetical protein n=1 Tax=Undibacterium sp. Ji83W TaxID=3413043 RepID=UPI003BF303F0
MGAKASKTSGNAVIDNIAGLNLSENAKQAAESLLAQFPNDIRFTSGRRSAAKQASAMATNVAAKRKWIQLTYKDTPQRAALQKWVDDHPEAIRADQITAGLVKVMNSWKEADLRNFSRHMSGDAFDVAPVSGPIGEQIKVAISVLPKLQWHTFNEGGLEIWHAQF